MPTPQPMTFEFVKAAAAADLAAVAELFVNASEAVARGDVGQIANVATKVPGWAQMLVLRHEARMDELRESETLQQKTSG